MSNSGELRDPSQASLPPGGWWGPPVGEGGGVLRPLAIVVRRLRSIMAMSAAFVALGVGLALVLPLRYEANATFVPERNATQVPGALAGLATQFGVNLGGGEMESPSFYARVIRSRAVLGTIVRSGLELPPEAGRARGDSVDVLEFLRIRGDTPEEREQAGLVRLQEIISTSVDARTDVVSMTVHASDPFVAAALANRILLELDRFNEEQRQSSAGEERRFLEERLREIRVELRASEDSLSSFLESNRRIEDSPSLQFAQQRLQREVDLRGRLHESLEQAYEEARLREINNTPVITVIESPIVPARHSWPRRRMIVMFAAVLGLVVAVMAAFWADHVARAREVGDPDLIQLERTWRGLWKRRGARTDERAS